MPCSDRTSKRMLPLRQENCFWTGFSPQPAGGTNSAVTLSVCSLRSAQSAAEHAPQLCPAAVRRNTQQIYGKRRPGTQAHLYGGEQMQKQLLYGIAGGARHFYAAKGGYGFNRWGNAFAGKDAYVFQVLNLAFLIDILWNGGQHVRPHKNAVRKSKTGNCHIGWQFPSVLFNPRK